jgi:hypothetical protein
MWKAQGKAAFLCRVGILRLGALYGAGMEIYFIFFGPCKPPYPSVRYFVLVTALVIVVSVFYGLSMGLFSWWAMMKKYG